jgi:predicted DCC family thiol-disulfide oxidoreductase YuxK
LYDGHCALCNWTVRLVLRFDRKGRLKFAPLSGSTAAAVLSGHPHLTGVDSLVLVDDGRASVRSAAVFAILAYLGGPWNLLRAARVIPREIRDALYDVIAHWRKRLFGAYSACPLPPPEHRDRFLP